ncbi:hypothetical protein Tco_0006001 [Tanacetum coccineum]
MVTTDEHMNTHKRNVKEQIDAAGYYVDIDSSKRTIQKKVCCTRSPVSAIQLLDGDAIQIDKENQEKEQSLNTLEKDEVADSRKNIRMKCLERSLRKKQKTCQMMLKSKLRDFNFLRILRITNNDNLDVRSESHVEALPLMPEDGGHWSFLHSSVMPTLSFLEFMMFSRMFADSLDRLHYLILSLLNFLINSQGGFSVLFLGELDPYSLGL